MSRFKHLERTIDPMYDWEEHLLKKSLPKRAFTNVITANILLASELMLGISYSTARKIRTYFRQ